jgi:hypothetical protein
MADNPTRSNPAEPELVIDESSRPGTDTKFWINLAGGLIFLAIVLGLVRIFQQYQASNKALYYYYAIIWERGPIQFWELLFAGMVLTHVLQKLRILRRQVGAMALAQPILETVDFANDEEISATRRKLRDLPEFEDSILLTRLDRVLAQWLGTRDVGLVSTWSGTEGQRFGDSSAASHNLVGILTMGITMLGFIGTVLGLGQAVSGFSSFLSGAIDLELIKGALRGVTGNLGIAFDTTLLALVLVLALTFPTNTIARRETDAIGEIDNFIDDKIISRLPSSEPASIRIENLEDSIDAAFRRYIPDPDRYDEVFSRAIDKAADVMQQKFSLLTSSYEAALTDMVNRLAGSLGAVGDSMESTMRAMVLDVQRQDEAMVNIRKAIAAEESTRLKSMLADFQEQSGRVAGLYNERAKSLEASTREGMDRTISAAQQLAERLSDIRDTAAKLDKMLRLQESVDKSLTGLTASEEFTQMLQDLRGHLAQTDDFCRRISKPRVITLREEPLH